MATSNLSSILISIARPMRCVGDSKIRKPTIFHCPFVDSGSNYFFNNLFECFVIIISRVGKFDHLAMVCVNLDPGLVPTKKYGIFLHNNSHVRVAMFFIQREYGERLYNVSEFGLKPLRNVGTAFQRPR